MVARSWYQNHPHVHMHASADKAVMACHIACILLHLQGEKAAISDIDGKGCVHAIIVTARAVSMS
jgi:hypothetical protein